MNEKATSDIERELERIKAKAEAAGLRVKTKVIDPETQSKVKGAVVDLKDKIVKLNIPSHVYSGAVTAKDKLVVLKGKAKDKYDAYKQHREERREERRKIGEGLVNIGVQIDNIAGRLNRLEKKESEKP